MADSSAVAARRLRVMALKAAGMSNHAIAEQEAREAGAGAKPRSAAAVAQDLTRVLESVKALDDAQRALAVTLEMERLDLMQRQVEQVLRSAASTARCAACSRAGDPGMVLKAMDRQLRIMERRAALRGLDLKGKPETPAGDDELAEIRRRVNAGNGSPRRNAASRRRGVQ